MPVAFFYFSSSSPPPPHFLSLTPSLHPSAPPSPLLLLHVVLFKQQLQLRLSDSSNVSDSSGDSTQAYDSDELDTYIIPVQEEMVRLLYEFSNSVF